MQILFALPFCIPRSKGKQKVDVLKRFFILSCLAAEILFPVYGLASAGENVQPAKTASNVFTPFVDPLPTPPRIVVPAGQEELTISLQQFNSRLHRDFTSDTPMWGYNGVSPGPIIEVESGHPLRIHWKNELPTTHVFAAPAGMSMDIPLPGSRFVFDGPRLDGEEAGRGMASLMGMDPMNMAPDVRNVTHLHGAKVWEDSPLNSLTNNDGWPDTWTVPGQEQIAYYPNKQDARTLFFHDHAMGETGRNVAAGLAGVYLIHDDFERSLNLPSGEYDIPIVLQGMTLKPDGSRVYTDRVDNEYYGNAVLVNGKLMPYLDVEPRKYRFRFVNASNARAYGLSLLDAADHTTPGPALVQIGSDAGFLEKSVTTSDFTDPNTLQLFLASAERADVIVDFSKFAGRNFILLNSNAITDPDGEIGVPQLMQFRVAAQVKAPDTSSLPADIRRIDRLDPATAVKTRRIVLSQEDHPDGSTMFRIDNRSWIYSKKDARGNAYWDYEIQNVVKANTTEIWEIVNASDKLQHPFHVHLVEFQVLDRRPFDPDAFKKDGTISYTAEAFSPDANEMGWKDVVRAKPHQVTRIIMHFGPETGYYVYHCHILEHEDMDMMVPFQVVK
jgi:spore coat protein A, manganese oxidase